jgi:hypothetical protein
MSRKKEEGRQGWQPEPSRDIALTHPLSLLAPPSHRVIDSRSTSGGWAGCERLSSEQSRRMKMPHAFVDAVSFKPEDRAGYGPCSIT